MCKMVGDVCFLRGVFLMFCVCTLYSVTSSVVIISTATFFDIVCKMFCVVQFDETGKDSLAVVHESWLTPLKKEVFWPPFKDRRSFRRAIAEGESVDTERWKLYGVNRIFYQTDDLDKAYKKEKEAEVTSDLGDTDIDKPRKKFRNRIVDTSDESEIESRYQRPPAVKIRKLSGAVEAPKGKFHTSYQPNLTLPCQSPQQSFHLTDEPSITLSPSSSLSQQISNDRYGDQTNNLSSNISNKIVISLLNQVKEQNTILLSKVEEIQKKLHNSDAQGLDIAFNKDLLPVTIPIKNEYDLNIFEEYLQDEQNFKSVVTYLSLLGGKNIKQKTHKILKELVMDSFVSGYSYFGKKGKNPFYELQINKTTIKSIQCKDQGATKNDIEEIIKLWIKHAPDRVKLKKHSA